MRSMTMNEAQESIFGPADDAMKKWAPYLEGIREANPNVSEFVLATTAICLENTEKMFNRMDETTKTVNIGSFIHHGFELIAAILPSMIANDVVTVQPMTRKIGEVFYLEYLYGTNRADVTAGNKMFAANVAGNTNVDYTFEKGVEDQLGLGAPPQVTFAGVLNTQPITSFSATDGLETFTITAPGVLTGSLGGTGTINLTTGAYSVTFNTAPTLNTPVVATYDVNFEDNPELIPEVNIDIQSAPVTAINQQLRARYTLTSAFDLESAFGKVADTELKAALASEVRVEADGRVLKDLRLGATSTGVNFSKTPAALEIPYSEHKWDFIDKSIIPMSNGIFAKTRRAVGNFIVAGTDVCNVIEALKPRFVKEGSIQPGPHYIGTLDGMRVYKNPFYPTGDFVVGYKGNLWIEAGYAWCPYLPLFTTRTVMLDDMIGRFGMIQSAGRKMINSDFYAKASVTA